MSTHNTRNHWFNRNLLPLAAILFGVATLPLYSAEARQGESKAPPAAKGKKKAEGPVNFIPAVADPLMGDWQGEGACVAQVLPTAGGKYRANLLTAFDVEGAPLAILEGVRSGDSVTFTGDGWSGAIKAGRFTGAKGDKSFTLKHVTRPVPSLGAPPPKGAVVLFDGHNLDAWAKKNGKSWLEEDGPARWKLIEGGIAEAVVDSDCIITHKKFGDCKVHVEFRTLGFPSNSGVFLQDRYEANINETYALVERSPNAGFDNCTQDAKPRIRPCRPPLEWQTFDIDFHAPRFDAAGAKTASARATVLFNGVKIYDNQALNRPSGAASRLGEAPTGPLMLQEHGMPVQFRNIWLVETGS
jgi:hypothetical protein